MFVYGGSRLCDQAVESSSFSPRTDFPHNSLSVHTTDLTLLTFSTLRSISSVKHNVSHHVDGVGTVRFSQGVPPVMPDDFIQFLTECSGNSSSQLPELPSPLLKLLQSSVSLPAAQGVPHHLRTLPSCLMLCPR